MVGKNGGQEEGREGVIEKTGEGRQKQGEGQ